LDEYRIQELLAAKAPVDGFGVGTRLTTGANYNPITREGGPSAVQGVYKLVEQITPDGTLIPKTKLSPEKILLPYRKQIYRHQDEKGLFIRDTIALWKEPVPNATPLLEPIILNGKLVYEFSSLEDMRNYCRQHLMNLPKPYRMLSDAPVYPVKLSPRLSKEKEKLLSQRVSTKN
jgi:nicotinate phosphoribosyltransferase